MIRHVRHRLDNLDRIDQYPTSLCHGAICYLRESGARVDEVKSSLKPTLAPLDASLLTTTLLALEKERPVPAADDPIRHTELHYEPHADSPLEQHHRVGHAGDKAVRELQPATDIERPALRIWYVANTQVIPIQEGLKAHRGNDHRLRLLRPARNCSRLRSSALRGGLPDFDPEELEKLIVAFLAVDGPRWLPDRGTFLYVRPSLIGTTAALGVSKPAEALLFVIAVLFPQFGQAGPGLKLLCSSPGQVRAWPGGFGNAKLGANYAPTLEAQEQANKQGFIQILWLFGPEEYVTEAGASNFFVVVRNKETGKPELVTPPLGDIILDGVTRRSVLELARERMQGDSHLDGGPEPVDVAERQLTIVELTEASKDGRLMEAFVTGTAFFIAPVRVIRHGNLDLEIGSLDDNGTIHAPYGLMLREWMRQIVYGEEDSEWACLVEENSP
ncbi:hypothetical protein MGN70_003180 [Eutypa lata]|nr:hypothetical protein MGN70_003180 [Eutypa lata]